MSSFDRAHATSHSPFTETVFILYHFRNITSYLPKFLNFFSNPRVFSPIGVSSKCSSSEKWSLQAVCCFRDDRHLQLW